MHNNMISHFLHARKWGFDTLLRQMKDMISDFQLNCPLDQTPLDSDAKTLKCAQGHHFDIAKQGHVNLLPVQHKKSKDPGDSKAMVNARRRFLDSGVYQAISNTLNQVCTPYLAGSTASQHILDAGCGEGYYLNALSQAHPNHHYLGLDISKWAVKSAAGRNPELTWVVGSNKYLPLPDQSVDLIVCLFGFPQYIEFARVLRPGGHLIMVDPAPQHLIEMRHIIFETVRTTPLVSIQPAFEAGFLELDTQFLNHKTGEINPSLIADLMAMTPYFYRASAEGKTRLANLKNLSITLDIGFRILKIK